MERDCQLSTPITFQLMAPPQKVSHLFQRGHEPSWPKRASTFSTTGRPYLRTSAFWLVHSFPNRNDLNLTFMGGPRYDNQSGKEFSPDE